MPSGQVAKQLDILISGQIPKVFNFVVWPKHEVF